MKLPSLEAITKRYHAACAMTQVVDHAQIERALDALQQEIGIEPRLPVRFAANQAEFRAAAQAGEVQAGEVQAAWTARTAWTAWTARAAQAARAARIERAARTARALLNTWNTAFLAATVIGAVELRDVDAYRAWLPLLEALEAGAWLLCFTADGLYVATIPHRIVLDERGRLHCADAAAFAWLDMQAYFWHGVAVPEQVILRPKTITVEQIENEPNTEVRRVLVERYGAGRYLEDGGAALIQVDETGRLYRKDYADDEPLVMVRVENSTPEADGSRKVYWLPVPPTVRTAREGIAWSFGMTADEYRVAFES